MTLALGVSSSRDAFVYFCRDSIRWAQSREFRRQRWVNGTNVVCTNLQSHSPGESISAFFLQNLKFEAWIVLENNITDNTFRIFKSYGNIIFLIFVKIVNKLLKYRRGALIPHDSNLVLFEVFGAFWWIYSTKVARNLNFKIKVIVTGVEFRKSDCSFRKWSAHSINYQFLYFSWQFTFKCTVHTIDQCNVTITLEGVMVLRPPGSSWISRVKSSGLRWNFRHTLSRIVFWAIIHLPWKVRNPDPKVMWPVTFALAQGTGTQGYRDRDLLLLNFTSHIHFFSPHTRPFVQLLLYWLRKTHWLPFKQLK